MSTGYTFSFFSAMHLIYLTRLTGVVVLFFSSLVHQPVTKFTGLLFFFSVTRSTGNFFSFSFSYAPDVQKKPTKRNPTLTVPVQTVQAAQKTYHYGSPKQILTTTRKKCYVDTTSPHKLKGQRGLTR